MSMRPSPLPPRRDLTWLGVAALVSLLVILAATVVIIAGIVLGKSNDCEPGGQAPADMPHVIVTPQPIPFPGPSGGVR